MVSAAFNLLPSDDIELTIDEPDSHSPHVQISDLKEYDPGKTSYRIALGGLFFSTIFTIACIGAGIGTLGSLVNFILGSAFLMTPTTAMVVDSTIADLPSLGLNLLVTTCTESIGFIHSKLLQAALISEHNIQFNTNLRLIPRPRSGRSWTHPNGTFSNVIMGILLILSYVSSSLVFAQNQPGDPIIRIKLQSPALIVLGVALLLQALIAYLGMRRESIFTWSSSPFHTTAALLYHNQLIHKSGKCMHNVLHSDSFIDPCTPSILQPSVWQVSSSVRRIVIGLWCLWPACAVWSGIVIGIGKRTGQLVVGSIIGSTLGMGSWSPLPNTNTSLLVVASSFQTSIVVMAALQGPLTMALHCCELLVNLLRDEAAWRKAVEKLGAPWSKNPLLSALMNKQSVGLFVVKSVLYWMFGLSLGYGAEGLSDNALFMRPVQILYLSAALLLLAAGYTFMVTRQPSGCQPATYGHLQTLANLIDDWSPLMWWGHKGGGQICHAGTSDHPLPHVNMNTLYAGNSQDR
ncbi:hypothetical protein PILCRDRAFT_11719 [Piloderma croceum F 1598]|uniref:Uncharacterized protein n=1 Tax=Piloderma croceum (strain F 1598) TaxID=765440 RepID=A0A0C3FDH8_PILCF|nr:hypothetical protein PILCRDRAFT_11719 [Piloderma croceum F 1598]